jgi:hypothetical protein
MSERPQRNVLHTCPDGHSFEITNSKYVEWLENENILLKKQNTTINDQLDEKGHAWEDAEVEIAMLKEKLSKIETTLSGMESRCMVWHEMNVVINPISAEAVQYLNGLAEREKARKKKVSKS